MTDLDKKPNLNYDEEEVNRMVQEYNAKNAATNSEDMPTENDLHKQKVIRHFDLYLKFVYWLFGISMLISVIEGIYKLNTSDYIGGRRRQYLILLSPVISYAVLTGEKIGGCNKITGPIFSTLGAAFAIWFTFFFHDMHTALNISMIITFVNVVAMYVCCLFMNYNSTVNEFVLRQPDGYWFAKSTRK